jgi:hypothetical protein
MHFSSLFRGGGRGAVLFVLLAVAAFGLLMDYQAVREYLWEQTNGSDGLGLFFPMIAVCAFAPFQLGAAIAIAGAARRRNRIAELESEKVLELDGQRIVGTGKQTRVDIDEYLFERIRVDKVTRTASLLLGVPAAIMTFCALLSRVGLTSAIVAVLAEPMSFVWAPSWFAGVLVGALALGRHEKWRPLVLAPLYPIMCLVYMQS